MTTNITSCFANDVEHLTDTYYTDHNDDCEVCKGDEQADAAESEVDTSAIPLTAIVKITNCGHIFHLY